MTDAALANLENEGKRSRYPFTVDPVAGLKTREFPTEEAAALAETFLRRLGATEGVRVPRVHRREGRRLTVDYLPGKALTATPDRDMILTVAGLQARVHALDWPGHEGREACAENYLRYFREYLAAYERLGLATDALRRRLARRFETAVPFHLHPALIHDDLWGGNVLYHQGDVFLIDYASVKFLALESDLLNSARYFQTRTERLTRGLYSMRTLYARAYAEGGTRMREVVQEIEANRPFFIAFNALRKGCNMLYRARGEGADKRTALRFAMRRLRHVRGLLKA